MSATGRAKQTKERGQSYLQDPKQPDIACTDHDACAAQPPTTSTFYTLSSKRRHHCQPTPQTCFQTICQNYCKAAAGPHSLLCVLCGHHNKAPIAVQPPHSALTKTSAAATASSGAAAALLPAATAASPAASAAASASAIS